MLERSFKNTVIKRLKEIDELYFFVKEALALRGIPDIIMCYKGRFFAWELKRDSKEASKKTGRIVLQRYTLQLIRKAGGVGELVHPDNLEEKLEQLLSLDDR